MTHRGPFQPLLFCDSVTSSVPWDLSHLFSVMTTVWVKFQPSSYILPNIVKSSWYQLLIPRSQQLRYDVGASTTASVSYWHCRDRSSQPERL